MKTTDTIVAISTPPGNSGIGIVRLSGDESIEIADKIFKGRKKLSEADTHTINYGYIYDGDVQVDQVLVMLMKAPHTYTGEDTVEIDCHGGYLVLQKILALAVKNGAILAEPGEYTKRAFLNGKMDLAQAEAVIDIIEADNEYALRTGNRQLKGKLSEEIHSIRAELLTEIAYIEAALDDPEHFDLTGYPEELKGKVTGLKNRIDALLADADTGIILKEGIKTVIAGRPNAGKSSVYNLLTGSDSAIVTEIAGTTRDTLTENILLGGISLKLTDTAGLRESDDVVEKIGVSRAREAAKEADLIICIIDSSDELFSEDIELLKTIENKKALILLNKNDLCQKCTPEEIKKYSSHDVIVFSARKGTGLDVLTEKVQQMFYRGDINIDERIYITSVRHKEALRAACISLEDVIKGCDDNQPEDFLTIDLTDAYEALGLITGETVGDEIIEEIFSKFCLGK